jgi:hypothetical protein
VIGRWLVLALVVLAATILSAQPLVAGPGDSDGDLLPDSLEETLRQCPGSADADSDGDVLSDGLEAYVGSNICAGDSDRDGLTDGAEVYLSSLRGTPCPHPLDRDSDGDGWTDGQERDRGTNICSRLSRPVAAAGVAGVELAAVGSPKDTDGDLLPDATEDTLRLCPGSNDADSDDDVISDGVEAYIGSNICAADTDRDGLTDGEEIYLSSVRHAPCPHLLDRNSDGDGWTDGEERDRSTNSCNRLNPPFAVLMVGDSLAWTLPQGLYPYEQQYFFKLHNVSIIGCSLIRGDVQLSNGTFASPDTNDECRVREQIWGDAVATHRPQVVLVLPGVWDAHNHRVNGQLLVLGTPAARAYWLSELRRVADLLGAQGAHVVFLTTPLFPPGAYITPARVAELNSLTRTVASERPGHASLIDLNHFLYPNGQWVPYINGINVRGDGYHFSREGALMVGGWLAPQLLALGR